MKYRPHFLPLCLMFVCLGARFVEAAPTVLIDSNGEGCGIVISADAPATIREAAKDLVYHLEKMSGIVVPIVTDASEVTGVPIYIGVVPNGVDLPMDLADHDTFWPSGYLMIADGRHVILAAPSVSGVRNAVYGLLEDHLGCHWFTIGPIGEHIPRHQTVMIDMAEDYQVVKPFHEIRMPWYGTRGSSLGSDLDDPSSPEFADPGRFKEQLRKFKIRNRMEWRGYWGHYWYKIYTSEVFEKYPDMAPFYDGKRHPAVSDMGGQICMSHPMAADVAIDYFVNFFKENPHQDFFSFSANDGSGWCECDNCKAMASNNAGRVLLLANKVLDGISAVYPDKRLAIYIYYETFEPPTNNIKAHPNLIGVICRAGFDGNSSWMEQVKPVTSNHPDMVRYRKYIETWTRDVGLKTAFKYDYVNWFPGPYTMFRKLQADHGYYTHLGIVGDVSEYMSRYMGTDVHMWLALRLGWDEQLTVDQLLDQFYPAYYGPAAEDMRYVYERLEGHMKSVTTAQTRNRMYLNLMFDLYPQRLLDQCISRVRIAKDKVLTDKLRLARIERDETCLVLTRLMVKTHAAVKAYYRTGRASDKNEAIAYADEFAQIATQRHITMPYGSSNLMSSFTFDKVGPFKKKDFMSVSRGSMWRAKSVSGFTPGLEEDGVCLPPQTAGEIIYEVKAANHLLFDDVQCLVAFVGKAENKTLQISTDDGKSWVTIPGARKGADLSGYVTNHDRFLVKITAHNPTDQKMSPIYKWEVSGSIK